MIGCAYMSDLLLETKFLSKCFKRGQCAVNNVSLSIKKNTVYAYL